MKEDPKSKYEITTDLIKSLVWPLFFSILILAYRGPISESVSHFPFLLRSSTKLSLAGISVDIDKALKGKASDDVLRIISQLSPDGYQDLIDLARGRPIFPDEEKEHYEDRYKELIGHKLVEMHIHDSNNLDHKNSVRQTRLGHDVQQFIFVIISDVVAKEFDPKD